MANKGRKSIARSLGEFFGHIARAVKPGPPATGAEGSGVKGEGEEKRRMVLRRTTVVEEVELPGPERGEEEGGGKN